MSTNSNLGSQFDDFLNEEGELKAIETKALQNLLLQKYSKFCNDCFGTLREGVDLQEFLYIALVGEIGEVNDVYKKHLRGSYHYKDNNNMLLELGDCFYYFCMMCKKDFVPIMQSVIEYNNKSQSFINTTKDLLAVLCGAILDTIDLYMIGRYLYEYTELLGYTLEEVLEGNINKLIEKYNLNG